MTAIGTKLSIRDVRSLGRYREVKLFLVEPGDVWLCRKTVSRPCGEQLRPPCFTFSEAAVSTGMIGLAISFLRCALDRASSRLTYSVRRCDDRHSVFLGCLASGPSFFIAATRPRDWFTRAAKLQTRRRRRVDTRRPLTKSVF